jgi:dienelactone hydrolase
MRRAAVVLILAIATALTVANLLLVWPNDLVEFFAGFAAGSVARVQLAIVIGILVAVGLSVMIERRPPAWIAATRIALLGALLLAVLGSAWREMGRFSRSTERFDLDGASLAATLYRPRGDERLRPAVLVLHGSGDRPRGTYHFLARRFAERGFVVLNADKRGVGESGGSYQGDDVEGGSVIVARDLETRRALAHLASLHGVDTARVGVVTISQGGWVSPGLLDGSSPARFAINISGPAVSAKEEGAWSEWTNESADHFGMKPPPVPFEELDRRMRSVTASGFDPRPQLRRMTQPSLWLFGEWDSSLPTRASIAVLDSLIEQGKPVTWRLFPEANHGLFIVRGPNGRRFARYAPGVWDSVFAWTDRQRITRP